MGQNCGLGLEPRLTKTDHIPEILLTKSEHPQIKNDASIQINDFLFN